MSIATAERPVSAPEHYHLPEGPNTPSIFNGLVFLAARQRAMKILQRRYGDAYTVTIPTLGRTVVLCHPDLVKAMFTADPTVLHGGDNPLGQVLGPGSMFSLDEDEHLRERRM